MGSDYWYVLIGMRTFIFGMELRKTIIDTDSNLYRIVTLDLLSPCCVSQPQRSFSYARGFPPCRTIKSLAALDAFTKYENKNYYLLWKNLLNELDYDKVLHD
jgi:hypothetical protein